MPKSGRVLRFLVPAALGFLLVAFSAQAHQKLQVGDLPPQKLGFNKLSDYRGKIVIVSFWASWCNPCRQEMVVLASIQKRATRDKVVIFAVNWKESAEQFRAIENALHNIDLTLVSDENGYLGMQYDVHGIPHMVIIGRDGRIAAIHIGYGEKEIPVLVDEINSLWGQGADP